MKILCGCDLSSYSEPAMKAAVALATRLPVAELWFVHILDAASASLGLGQLKDGATSALKQRIAALDMPAEVQQRCEVLVTAAPSDARSTHDALLHFGRRHGAQLVVVASQGYGASPLVRLGGTSERLAHAADLPVLVVRDSAPFAAWARKQRPMRVLLGSDGSPRSRPAAELVKQLIAAGDCELIVGRVYDAGDAVRHYGVAHPGDWLRPDPQLEALITRDLAREFDAPPDANVRYRSVLGIGRRGDHLLDLAEREAADLIVVGTHPKSWLDRLSSVSSVVLHFGHASVACVPAPHEISPATARVPSVHRVLAATDLSELGNAAIPHALALLGKGPGELFLLHVTPGETSEHDTLLASELRALLPRSVFDSPIAVRTEIIHGDDPVDAIVTAARRLGADVICLGSHGRSGVRRAVLGSVAEGVLRAAQQPVFIVRAPSASPA